MATIFISHSNKDTNLVLSVKGILENIGHKPIIEEFIPKDKQLEVPYAEIRTNVERSDFVFLFLTDNIVKTEYTHNWVVYEDGLASAQKKRVYVFERLGMPIPYPIPYVTDYALFNPANTDDLLKVQALAKTLGNFRKDLITASAGAAAGSIFGPVGMVIGAIAGYALGPKQQSPPRTKCNGCNVSFNYYSPNIREFRCPVCRGSIVLK